LYDCLWKGRGLCPISLFVLSDVWACDCLLLATIVTWNKAKQFIQNHAPFHKASRLSGQGYKRCVLTPNVAELGRLAGAVGVHMPGPMGSPWQVRLARHAAAAELLSWHSGGCRTSACHGVVSGEGCSACALVCQWERMRDNLATQEELWPRVRTLGGKRRMSVAKWCGELLSH
jgi:hypothetical protein